MLNEYTREDLSLRDQMVALASAVPGLIYSFRIGPDGTASMPFASPGIDEIFGVPSEEVVRNFTGKGRLIHADDALRVRTSIEHSARVLMPWRQEFRVLHPRRGVRWVEANSRVQREADGATVWHGYMQDVTDRRHADESIHLKTQMLSAQQEASTDGILVVNADLSISSMNSRFLEMWGGPRELIDETDHKGILRYGASQFADPKGFLQDTREIYAEPRRQSEKEYSLADGRVVERRSYPFFRPDGEYSGRMWTYRDVTEARRAEDALRESERLSRSTLDSLLAHIAILDAEGNILAVNAAWRNFASDNADETGGLIEGANYLATCDAAQGPAQGDAHAIAKGIREVLAGSLDRYSLEYPCHSPTQKRWFCGHVTRFSGDGPLRLVVAHEDITARVMALDELRESKALLTQMGKVARIGGWEVDLTSGSWSWTEETARICGLATDAAMTPERAIEFYAGKGRNAIVNALSQVLVKGRAFDLELEFESADGVLKWVRTICSPESQDGRVVMLRGSLQDISEKKKADLALRESAMLLSTVFRVIPIAIHIFRLCDRRSIMANEGYLELTGFSYAEVFAHSAEDLGVFPSPEVGNSLMNELAEGRAVRKRDMQLRSKRGELKDVIVSLNPVTLSGELAVIMVATDITDRKRAEAEMKLLQDKFLHAQKMEAIGQLAGGVAHDFNNLLQVINAYSERIEEDYAHDATLVGYGRSIHKAGQMAANLTRQLLAFSRNAPVRPRKVKMDVVLEGAAEMVRRLVGEDITVETVLNAPAGFIQVDPSQIEQIVLNLAVNGRDAMPNGGVLRLTTGPGQASIKTTPLENSKGPRFVQLTVSDTGVGMDAETQKRAFEPFFTTKPLGQGTGLGLSTVYGVVEQFGGRIEIESELGVGTRVSIIIPMVEGAKTEVMDVNKDAPKALTSGARAEHILVVEDVANLRSLYEEGLRRSGYRVKTAENGKEALALMAKASEPFDLIVSDAMMPVMGGIELFEKLERSHSGLKRLLISGYAGDRQRWEEASSFGEVLAKPFSINAFTAKVRQVLDGASVHM